MSKLKKIIKVSVSFLRDVYVFPVKLYRRYLSPLKGNASCRFTPTCSEYAITAVREWGIIAGTVLALWRIIRCNPFSEGGEDPVPRRPRFSELIGKGDKKSTGHENSTE